MFNKYYNIPTSYDIYTYETINLDWNKIKKPLEEYNAKNELIGYSWYYGDEIVLEFETTGTVDYATDIYDSSYNPSDDSSDEHSVRNVFGDFYEDVEDYLSKGILKLELYDFRREKVFEQCLPGSSDVKFLITAKSSERLFKGVYRCKLTFIGEQCAIQTLINPEDYIIMIK